MNLNNPTRSVPFDDARHSLQNLELVTFHVDLVNIHSSVNKGMKCKSTVAVAGERLHRLGNELLAVGSHKPRIMSRPITLTVRSPLDVARRDR
jgi:hypothetical protein